MNVRHERKYNLSEGMIIERNWFWQNKFKRKYVLNHKLMYLVQFLRILLLVPGPPTFFNEFQNLLRG